MTKMIDIVTKNLIIDSLVKDEKVNIVSNETVNTQVNMEIIVTKLNKPSLRFVLADTFEYSNPDNKSDKTNVYSMGSIVGVDELHEVIVKGKSMSQYFYKTIDNGYINADTLAEIYKSSCFAKTDKETKLRFNFIDKSKKVEIVQKDSIVLVCTKLANSSYVLYNGKRGYVDNDVLEEFKYSSENLLLENAAPLF